MVRDIEDEIRDEKNPRPLLKTYKVEKEIKELAKRINDLCGIKASDTCLAPPSPWDLESDEQIMQEGQPLQVGRCTEIIRPNIEDAKYVINVKQIAKSVVGLGDKVSPTDIEQGTRVGYISCLRETPIDLLMDIFSRVPAKSIARFRCLSKLWESILCRPDFTELFLTMSSTRPPLLLFTFEDDGKLFFFSSPHPQNPDENTSLVPTRYCVQHKNCPTNFSSEIGSPLRGFICHQDRGSQDTIVICNPVTGESVCLPKVELKSINTETRPYLGYDPIHKQLKVLCIKSNDIPNTCDEHQVLTLENGKHLWRTIQCKPHYPKSDGICLDGILYYTAGFDRRIRVSMIVCFDVGSEKFSFINIDDCMLMTAYCTLINYKGKLGALQFTFLFPRRLEFWVLDNAERYAWSKDIYALPPLWNNIVERTELAIVGMTGGGDVVLSPYCIVDAFYI